MEQLLLFQLPLELTFHALVELLVFGERSHQLVARRAIPQYKAELSAVHPFTEAAVWPSADGRR